MAEPDTARENPDFPQDDNVLDFCCGSKKGKCPKFTENDDGSVSITDPDVFSGEIRLNPAQAEHAAHWFSSRRSQRRSAQVELHDAL